MPLVGLAAGTSWRLAFLVLPLAASLLVGFALSLCRKEQLPDSIHSGPVVGSIVGVQKYVYDIFGPGVNLAARMEAISDPMQITLSADTYELVREDFVCGDLGELEVKGFGTQHVYSLDGEKGSSG